MSRSKRRLINTKRYLTQRLWLWLPPIISMALLAGIHLTDINHLLFYKLNSVNQYTGTSIWANITILGDMLVLMVLALPWIRRRPDLVWAFVIAGLVAFFASHGLKQLVNLNRPAKMLEAGSFILTGPAHKSFAFPSGHSTAVFMCATIWILSLRLNWLKSLVLLFASVVALSRVAVGVHWPVDILGGMIVGWFSALLGLMVIRRYRWGVAERGKHILSILLILSAVVMLFYHHTGYPQAEMFQRIIALVMLPVGLFEYSYLIMAGRRRKRTEIQTGI